MRHPDALPPELSEKWGHLRYVRRVSPVELHSECPSCGDSGHVGRDWPDRFFMRTDGSPRGFCRRCGYQAFANSDKEVSKEQREAWIAERLERELANKRKAERAIEHLRREQAHLRYHFDGLNEEALRWWASKGIPGDYVAALYLGWCKRRDFWNGKEGFSTPTATIPVFSPGWNLQNIRHRLINPTNGSKYRPETPGLPASLYYAKPSREPDGECLLVEGEIKAAVTWINLEEEQLDVIGTPGKSFKPELLDYLIERCDRIYVAFDPDAARQSWETCKYIGKAARRVCFPEKPDDLFTMYGCTKQAFRRFMSYGRSVV